MLYVLLSLPLLGVNVDHNFAGSIPTLDASLSLPKVNAVKPQLTVAKDVGVSTLTLGNFSNAYGCRCRATGLARCNHWLNALVTALPMCLGNNRRFFHHFYLLLSSVLYYFITALTPLERRSLIPMSLRKKLCERSGDRSICNFGKGNGSLTQKARQNGADHASVTGPFKGGTNQTNSSHNSIDDDDNYSKWSICKHHPELLLCRWNPSSRAVIPIVQPEMKLTTHSWNSIEASFEEDTDSGVNALSLMPAIFESSIFMDSTPAPIQPQRAEEVRIPVKEAPPTFKEQNPGKEDRPRYDGKLSDERELPAQTVNSDESPDVDDFGEDIMMVKEGVFG
ncbi:hypothetical protein Y032_0328g2623 [Ancylostoma ceylanicum]|uniref:SWIM-type domain-containing protein n=1 Tax=Ancylostoma ceylanicum TaxID=53326 RepID=A0A016S0M5_9BILA|nr:hypothetical protein Y032_0328g2623 [Ancylostoma ceylanicum]